VSGPVDARVDVFFPIPRGAAPGQEPAL